MTIKNILIALLIYCWCTTAQSAGTFKSINSVSEVEDIFDNATEEDLFVVDIDNTIFESKSPTYQSRFEDTLAMMLLRGEYIKDGRDVNFNNEEYLYDIQPVEQELISKIIKLQKRNIKTIALTARSTKIRVALKAKKQLKHLGIDFAQKPNIRVARTSTGALFCNGIYFTNGTNKGKSLIDYIEIMKTILHMPTPKRVYFFDDQYDNVNAVLLAMKRQNIECHGYHYTAATAKSRNPKDLDFNIARFQYALMAHLHTYVTYQEATIVHAQVNIHKLVNNALQAIDKRLTLPQQEEPLS